MLDKTSARHWAFLAFTGLVVLAFHAPLYALLELSIGDFRYSHIAVVPLVSVCVVYFERKQVFAKCQRCLGVGIPVLLLGLITYAIATTRSVARTDTLWLTVSRDPDGVDGWVHQLVMGRWHSERPCSPLAFSCSSYRSRPICSTASTPFCRRAPPT